MPTKRHEKLSYRLAGGAVLAPSGERSVILKGEDISLTFGKITALSGASFEARDGEILAIIGPNGAGKTSLLNCINGFYKPQQGRIYFQDKDITALSPHKRAMLGLGRTFQGLQVYEGMSVLDTIMSGRHIHMKVSPAQAFLYWPWVHKEELEHRVVVEDIIDFLEIEHIRKQPIGVLSYGLRKRVDLARALALEPKILLLDEPMAGMNLEEKEDLARFILDIQEGMGTPIVIVEHDMEVVMDIAQQIVVIDWGQVIAQGTPSEIRVNQKVVEAYLGVGET
jgi:branched-chain amino acid transport system ATP-binding protein